MALTYFKIYQCKLL